MSKVDDLITLEEARERVHKRREWVREFARATGTVHEPTGKIIWPEFERAFSSGWRTCSCADCLYLRAKFCRRTARGKCCIYFLFDGDEMVYIGQTRYAKRRESQHRLKKQFTSVRRLDVVETDMLNLEKALIGHYRPRLNDALIDTCPEPYAGLLRRYGFENIYDEAA
jgi:hypothetical protein